MDRDTISNFGAGPAGMPTSVLRKVQDGLLSYDGSGMSLMEISHRSSTFMDLVRSSQKKLRALLAIPEDYEVLYVQGGGMNQFSATVLNLLAYHALHNPDQRPVCDYLVTGSWTEKAAAEASRLGAQVNIAVNAKANDGHFGRIPPESEWKLSGSKAAFVYYCDNETVNGVEFQQGRPPLSIPDGVPVVCDMSSNILSRRVDISKYAVIYAGAQKNIGPAGLTVVIVHKKYCLALKELEKAVAQGGPRIPHILAYGPTAEQESTYNTPPMFAIYIADLVFDWIKEQGGVQEMEKRAALKSEMVYKVIDAHPHIFIGAASPDSRSRMNVTFSIKDAALEKKFLSRGEEVGFRQLKGHRSVGGVRASLYNAVSIASVEKLVRLMEEFAT